MQSLSTAKVITFNRETRDFDATFDQNYIGSFRTFSDAENALNDHVLLLCEQGLVDQPLALQAEQALLAATPPHTTYPCPDCQGEGRIAAYGTGDQAGGYADTCQECSGVGLVPISYDPPVGDPNEPGPGPDMPAAESAVRKHLTFGHLRRDLFAPVFFCACGARATIVRYGDPDVFLCDRCHAADPDEQQPEPWPDGPCGNCGEAHHIQHCPEIAARLAIPDDTPADTYPDVPAGPGEPTYGDAGRALARQWHRDRARFLTVLRSLDRDAWLILAEAYAAYMSRFGAWIRPAHVLSVWAKAVNADIALPPRAA